MGSACAYVRHRNRIAWLRVAGFTGFTVIAGFSRVVVAAMVRQRRRDAASKPHG